ncbi:hypothetical protein J3F84DRAFT_371174 [Trichoderma pleuroticola]
MFRYRNKHLYHKISYGNSSWNHGNFVLIIIYGIVSAKVLDGDIRSCAWDSCFLHNARVPGSNFFSFPCLFQVSLVVCFVCVVIITD